MMWVQQCHQPPMTGGWFILVIPTWHITSVRRWDRLILHGFYMGWGYFRCILHVFHMGWGYFTWILHVSNQFIDVTPSMDVLPKLQLLFYDLSWLKGVGGRTGCSCVRQEDIAEACLNHKFVWQDYRTRIHAHMYIYIYTYIYIYDVHMYVY